MSGRICRQNERNYFINKDITRGLLPLAAGATLISQPEVLPEVLGPKGRALLFLPIDIN